MAESADDPALYWIEPQHRGILPLDRVHVPRRLARTVRTRPSRGHRRHRLRGRHRGLRRGPPRPALDLDQLAASAASTATCSTWATATPSRCGRRGGSPAASTAWRSAARSSARACSPTCAMPRKIALVHLAARLVARRLHAARHAVRDRPPAPVRHRSRSTATSFIAGSRRRSRSRPISCGSTPDARAGAACSTSSTSAAHHATRSRTSTVIAMRRRDAPEAMQSRGKAGDGCHALALIETSGLRRTTRCSTAAPAASSSASARSIVDRPEPQACGGRAFPKREWGKAARGLLGLRRGRRKGQAGASTSRCPRAGRS